MSEGTRDRARRWGGLALATLVLWFWLSVASGQFN